MQNSTSLIFILAVVLFSSSLQSNAQQKDCIQSPAIFNLGTDISEILIKVRNGKSCTRTLNYHGFDLKEIILVERPKFGKIELLDTGKGAYRYIAKLGYEGKDRFRIRYVGEELNIRSGIVINRNAFVGQTINVEIFK
jgi:hypothetical protein